MNGGLEGDTFSRFCVVGLGNHARTKLIPALTANRQQIVGVVTKQSYSEAPNFRHLEEALSIVCPGTVFVISTPPTMHFDQALLVTKAGFDLIIEKPAFTTERDALKVIAESTHRGTVLVEGFMHRYTELYRRMMAWFRSEQSSIFAVEATFVVPVMPKGTFRHNGFIPSSSLYDVGCYVLSLFADLGLPLDNLEMKQVLFPGDSDREILHLEGMLGEVSANARIGVDATYTNMVSFRTNNGAIMTFSPFFYGRSGEKMILRQYQTARIEEIVDDHNAFEELFAIPRRVWSEDQAGRTKRMTDVTAALERLGEVLGTVRRGEVLRQGKDAYLSNTF
jgi:predicted dehydrogenase